MRQIAVLVLAVICIASAEIPSELNGVRVPEQYGALSYIDLDRRPEFPENSLYTPERYNPVQESKFGNEDGLLLIRLIPREKLYGTVLDENSKYFENSRRVRRSPGKYGGGGGGACCGGGGGGGGGKGGAGASAWSQSSSSAGATSYGYGKKG